MNYYENKVTDRLNIRPLTIADAQVWEQFIMNEVATKFFPDNMKGKPLHASKWIEGQLKRYKENKYGLLGIELLKTGELIGQAGLLTQDIEGDEELEIGYHLLPKYWGNGYAIEAAIFFKCYVFGNQLSPSVISIIHVENKASQKVAERNGMLVDKKILFREMPAFVYRISEPQYFLSTNEISSN